MLAVMCSYNLVGGDHACENDYLLNHAFEKASTSKVAAAARP
jgi:hypothetical protein